MPDARKYYLDYRPHTYWGTPAARFANVKGEQRRQAIQRAITSGQLEEVPAELQADVLSPELRDAVGRIHPSLMGGEYLPDYLPGEVEIARRRGEPIPRGWATKRSSSWPSPTSSSAAASRRAFPRTRRNA
jgi:hypothetical protein